MADELRAALHDKDAQIQSLTAELEKLRKASEHNKNQLLELTYARPLTAVGRRRA